MTEAKINEGEKKLLAKVKREMNQPRLTESVRMDVEAQAKLKPERVEQG